MADLSFSLNFSVRGTAKPKAYDLLAEQLEALLVSIRDPLTAMAALACVHHYGFEHRWTGFYRVLEEERRLLLGGFHGPLAPLELPFGEGTAGLAAEQRRAIWGPGPLPSASELAVPLFRPAGALAAVMLLRHPRSHFFDATDVSGVEAHLRCFIAPRM
jgi:putative methionine-R-sulfoxide reductase with GAF domain